MQVTVDLPEDIAQELRAKWPDVTRAVLESVALEAYRTEALTAAQLRRLLGFGSRIEVEDFLRAHEVYDYTEADLDRDRETLRSLR